VQGSYDTVLRGSAAQAVFTDPPYNVAIRGHVSGKGRIQHREFVRASGEITIAEFQAFLAAMRQRFAAWPEAPLFQAPFCAHRAFAPAASPRDKAASASHGSQARLRDEWGLSPFSVCFSPY
jgi:hypothetical protein